MVDFIMELSHPLNIDAVALFWSFLVLFILLLVIGE
jgi:hypothetical protein